MNSMTPIYVAPVTLLIHGSTALRKAGQICLRTGCLGPLYVLYSLRRCTVAESIMSLIRDCWIRSWKGFLLHLGILCLSYSFSVWFIWYYSCLIFHQLRAWLCACEAEWGFWTYRTRNRYAWAGNQTTAVRWMERASARNANTLLAWITQQCRKASAYF